MFAGPVEVEINQRYKRSVVLVSVEGELYDGSRETVTGSGFVFTDDGYVVTSSHVVAHPGLYRNVEISGAFYTRAGPYFPLALVRIIDDLGVAVLKFQDGRFTPVPFGDASEVPEGSDLVMLSAPLDIDVMVSSGTLRGKEVNGYRWTTSLDLNPGDSGGPVFSAEARSVVAIGDAGVPYFEEEGGRVPVQGINYVLPVVWDEFQAVMVLASQSSREYLDRLEGLEVEDLRGSSLGESVFASAGYSATRIHSSSFPGNARLMDFGSVSPESWCADGDEQSCQWPEEGVELPQGVAESTAQEPVPPSEDISTAKRIDLVQDDHRWFQTTKKTHTIEYEAEDGYRITQIDLERYSVNNAPNVDTQILDDGRRARVQIALKSGPRLDEWRGWFRGMAILRQTPMTES